jgi:hypothetical protein
VGWDWGQFKYKGPLVQNTYKPLVRKFKRALRTKQADGGACPASCKDYKKPFPGGFENENFDRKLGLRK